MWGDGDLNYDVTIQANIFVRTGGDEDHIAGAFFGASHEGMGGARSFASTSAPASPEPAGATTCRHPSAGLWSDGATPKLGSQEEE